MHKSAKLFYQLTVAEIAHVVRVPLPLYRCFKSNEENTCIEEELLYQQSMPTVALLSPSYDAAFNIIVNWRQIIKDELEEMGTGMTGKKEVC